MILIKEKTMKFKIEYIFFILLTGIFLLTQKPVMGQVANIDIGNYQLEWHNNAQFVGGRLLKLKFYRRLAGRMV